MVVPRRYLFIVVVVVTIIALLLTHPATRGHINTFKDYGFEKVSNLIEDGKTFWSLHSGSPEPPSSRTQDDATHALPPSETTDDESGVDHSTIFTGEKWFFEYDNELYPQPQYDVHRLSSYAPHNYKGKGEPTLATFFATRNGSLQDPYFLAAQQQLYRVLWDPRSRSKHTMTVFVAPFVHVTQRRILQAAGANVVELPLVHWLPAHTVTAPMRWRDQFSKLNFWAQTDFSKILYMDVDAFPLENVDTLLDDIAHYQECTPELLDQEDKIGVGEMCNYTFTATRDQRDYLNAGMFVITPNKAMHTYLLRGMKRDRDKFDNNMIEQGYLNYKFRIDGPFPGQYINREWNAIETNADDEGEVHILHEKLWVFHFMPDHWATHYFNDTWFDMLRLYESPEFLKLRAEDGTANS